MDIGNARCPECGKAMTPVACRCDDCGIRMEGRFSVSILSQLSPEDQALIIAFVRSFGSIKRIQELLDVSYPTARARLEELVERLDSTMQAPDNRENMVLDRLKRGDITFRQAMEEL
ncbi:MAG: hypothetical protein AVO35_02970 [Candidatus Aegiribacteria sp. MLS_C]|nr:MAG: hypothetical protein AVO35_02970 [Candidatus Aegiribacteria sp. MLS_C]